MVPPPVFPQDMLDLHKAVSDFKKEMGTHIYRVVDISAMPSTLGMTIEAMAADMNPDGGVNDMGITSIYIGSGEWVKFGAKAFQEQQQYGPTNVKAVVSTVDEAMAFIRADRKA